MTSEPSLSVTSEAASIVTHSVTPLSPWSRSKKLINACDSVVDRNVRESRKLKRSETLVSVSAEPGRGASRLMEPKLPRALCLMPLLSELKASYTLEFWILRSMLVPSAVRAIPL